MTDKKSEVYESGYAEVNGLKMYYEIHGSGIMPLVLIHGGGADLCTTIKEAVQPSKGYWSYLD